MNDVSTARTIRYLYIETNMYFKKSLLAKHLSLSAHNARGLASSKQQLHRSRDQ